MSNLLAELEAFGEALKIDMPQVIVATDPATGHTIVFGPFPTAVEAFQFAERHIAALIDADFPEPVICTVHPLVAP